jgi:hypothetical protein
LFDVVGEGLTRRETRRRAERPPLRKTAKLPVQANLYIGRIQMGPLSGYLWLLGSRLYLKLGWRPSDTYFLGSQTLSP